MGRVREDQRGRGWGGDELPVFEERGVIDRAGKWISERRPEGIANQVGVLLQTAVSSGGALGL